MINEQGKKSMLLVRDWIRAEMHLAMQTDRSNREGYPHPAVVVESRMTADNLFNQVMDLMNEDDLK